MQQHAEELSKARQAFENEAKEIESKYEKKFNQLKQELNTKHKYNFFIRSFS